MANKFSNFTFTKEGLAVITDALANNTSLSIEQVYTFATKLTDTVVYSQLSGLSPKQIKPVGTVTAHDTTVETRVQIDNSDVTTGYNLQGVALVGTHNSVKFVIGYINANETTNIPVYDGVQSQTLSFDVSFAISDTSVVEVNVQTAGMLTVADYNALLAYVDSKTAPLATDTSVVHKTQNETIDGIKKFLKTIDGSINGNSNSTDYINQHVISANVDLNTLTTNGNYLSTATSKTTTNKPAGTSEQYTLASIGNVQFFNDMANDKLYLRNKITATTFTTWKQVAQLTDFGITNAMSATKLQTPRKLKVNLASTADQTFDGSADQVGIGVDGILPVKNGGSGRADDVNTGGTKGIEITDFKLIQLPPSDNSTLRGFPFTAGSTAVNKPNVSEAGFRGWFTTFDVSNTIEFIAVASSGNLYVGQGSTTVVNRLVTVTSITWRKLSDDSTVVHNTGAETIAGSKTFSAPVIGSITGNANTATKLQTYRNIKTNLSSQGAAGFDGTADIQPGVTGVLPIANGGTGNNTRLGSLNNLAFFGLNPSFATNNTDTTLDTVDNWKTAGTGYAVFNSASSKIAGYISTYGGTIIITNYVYAGEVYQEAISSYGYRLTRTQNNWGNWRVTADSNNPLPVVTADSSSTGTTYTITNNTLPSSFGVGYTFKFIPNVISTSTSATLSINGSTPAKFAKFNAYTGARVYAENFSTNVPASFLQNNSPYTLTYFGGYWFVLEQPIIDVTAPNGILPVKNGGTGRIDGQSQSVNSLSMTIQGFAVGNTITATQPLAGVTGKFYGNYAGLIGTNNGTFNVEFTSNGFSVMNVTARIPGSGITYTGVLAGTFSGSMFTITTAPTWAKLASDSTVVHNTGNETIAGTKTFSSPISGSITGNAGTATKLASPVSVGGVLFDGSASIYLPGVNIAGNQSTTGNAGSATKLQTARTINGVAFDGTANISVNAANDTSLVHKTGNETVAGVKTFSDWPVITGLNVSNGTNTSGIVRINASIPNQSNNNVPIGLNTGSTLVLGGGEAANSYLAAMAAGAVPIGSTDATNEQLVLAGDAAVYIGAGYQDGGTTGKWWAFNQDGTIKSPNGNLMQEAVSTTINLYGKGTYFVNDTTTDGDHLRLIVSGKVVSVQGTLMTKVAMSGGAYLGEAMVPAQYAPPVARKNTVGFNASSAGSKVYADVAWSIDGMLSLDNIVNGSNMTAWGTIPAGSQLSFADTWVLA